jgi:hypothetical protein
MSTFGLYSWPLWTHFCFNDACFPDDGFVTPIFPFKVGLYFHFLSGCGKPVKKEIKTGEDQEIVFYGKKGNSSKTVNYAPDLSCEWEYEWDKDDIVRTSGFSLGSLAHCMKYSGDLLHDEKHVSG